jgi:hypothetical protein
MPKARVIHYRFGFFLCPELDEFEAAFAHEVREKRICGQCDVVATCPKCPTKTDNGVHVTRAANGCQ